MKSGTIIVWYRADLRVHDHPALAAAVRDAEKVVPVFIFDDSLLAGRTSSANRNRFLLESVQDLRGSLRNKGGDLIIRHGDAQEELRTLAKETDASAVYYIADYTPHATKRDREVERALQDADITVRSFGGRLIVSSVQQLRTKSKTPYKVFTPFYKAWLEVERRDVAPTPNTINTPSIRVGSLPKLADITDTTALSHDVIAGGETAGRKRLKAFLAGLIDQYHIKNNDLGADGTSRLSPYLHFGCVSPREIESMLGASDGPQAWRRQLAWRDFYHYVLLNFPHPEQEFQERYRNATWGNDEERLNAWKDGRTGYPVVDAAMRQLKQEGWMHNRARLIVGSFLTKDLGLDWRAGEQHFMQWLLDGDMANNNGNWQWIASVGVDPAPVFRRLYNPTSQRNKFDPDGSYVRRFVPELANVPDEHLSEPWRMTDDEQAHYKCNIDVDYPSPTVDHKVARAEALEWYRST